MEKKKSKRKKRKDKRILIDPEDLDADLLLSEAYFKMYKECVKLDKKRRAGYIV